MPKLSNQRVATRARKERARVLAGDTKDAREAELAARISPKEKKRLSVDINMAVDSTKEDKLDSDSEGDEQQNEAKAPTLVAQRKLTSSQKILERYNADEKRREEDMAVCYDEDEAYESEVDVVVANNSNTGDEASEPSEPESLSRKIMTLNAQKKRKTAERDMKACQ